MSREEDNAEVVDRVYVVETVDEPGDLEPITIGEVTEVTGSGSGGAGDFVLVWGT
jgi:hypothetical protein